MLEGALTFRFGDPASPRTAPAPAGAFALVPPGAVHAFGNAGSDPARYLLLFTPAGMERYLEERLALERTLPPGGEADYSTADTEALAALARKYGFEFV